MNGSQRITFRQYAAIVRNCIRASRQQERRFSGPDDKKYLSKNVSKKRTFIGRKFESFINWYDEFTGMDEVRAAQKMVLEDEENFRKSQILRRKILNDLTEIQQKLKDLYVELENTARGDERYVTLVTQEHKLLKEEKRILEQFNRAERTEREAFSALSSSVKMSHEKERSQSERTKYWSIIGSVIGTIIGLLGSSINSHFKMNELKELIKSSTNMQLVECLNHYVDSNEKVIENYKRTAKLHDKKNLLKLEETLLATNKKLSEVEASLKQFEKVAKHTGTDGVRETEHDFLETSLKKDYSQIKLLLFSVAVLSVVMPIISR